MEALVALSLACNIVQLVDFGLKVASKGHQIYLNGVTVKEEEYHATAQELSNFTHALTESIKNAGNRTALSADDRDLYDLGEKCHSVAQELESELQRLPQVVNGGVKSSIYKSLKLIRRSRKIQELNQKLLSCKNILDSGILVQLFRRSRQVAVDQNDRLLSLDSTLQRFIASNAQGFFKTDDLIKREVHYIHDHITSEGKNTRDHVAIVGAKITKDIQNMQLTNDDMREHRNALLQSLVFPEMNLRQEQIAEPYRNTYEWIFSQSEKGVLLNNEQQDSHPWFSFVNWLRASDSNLYWIYGRAGSGKSTLMNFISSEPRTRKYLSEGQGLNGSEYMQLAFFFWRPGNLMQKSSRGLLQSLLYQILSQNEQALASAVPQLVRPQKSPPYLAWSARRLTHLLDSTISTLSCPLFILLDGLDEFEEDEEDLLSIIQSLQAHRNVKICISSRPLRSFEKKFGDCPRLRLQDLTRRDLELYVNETFSQSTSFLQLREQHPKDMAKMIESILWLAEGGFLWTRMVVRDLIRGMDNRDSLEVLAQKMESTPTEVDEMYTRMWNRSQEGSKYYEEEVQLWFRMILRGEMSLLEFTILTDKDAQERILKNEQTLESRKFLVKRCEDKRVHVLARCAGLLEVGETVDFRGAGREPFADVGDDALGNMHKWWWIRLSHRTAADFLERKLDPELKIKCVSDLNLRLRMRCMLWRLVPIDDANIDMYTELWQTEKLLERWITEKSDRGRLLPDVFNTLRFMEETYTELVGRLPSTKTREAYRISSPAVDFMGVMIQTAPPIGPLYVRKRLEEMDLPSTQYLTYLLRCANGQMSTPELVPLITYLLKQGANPLQAASLGFRSAVRLAPWTFWVGRLWVCFPSYLYASRDQIFEALKAFRGQGADMAQSFPVYLAMHPYRKWPSLSWAFAYEANFGPSMVYGLFVRTNVASLIRRVLRGQAYLQRLNIELGIENIEDCFDVVMLLVTGAWKMVASREDSKHLVELADNAFWEGQFSSGSTEARLAAMDVTLLEDLRDEFQPVIPKQKGLSLGPHREKLFKEVPRLFNRTLPLTIVENADNRNEEVDKISEEMDKKNLADIDWPTSFDTGSEPALVNDVDYDLSQFSSWTHHGVKDLLQALSATHGGPEQVQQRWNIPRPIMRLLDWEQPENEKNGNVVEA